MKFSFKNFSSKCQTLTTRVLSQTTWKEDLSCGIKALFLEGSSVADRSFSELELIRLRYQLQQLEEKLGDAYQVLGKKSMEHWEHQQDLDEKEKTRLFRQIDLLEKEKDRITEQMEAEKNPSKQDIATPSQPVSE